MSDLIEWTPQMSVGVALFDEDHRRIMKLINRLHEAILEKRGKEVLVEIFSGLTAYITLHFESEEEVFERTGYEGGEDQKRQHRDMAARTAEIRQKLLETPDDVQPIEVLYFLKDWWIGHILNADKKYQAFLNEKGIV